MSEFEKLLILNNLNPSTIEIKCYNNEKNGGVVSIKNNKPYVWFGNNDGSDDRFFEIDEFNKTFIISLVIFE